MQIALFLVATGLIAVSSAKFASAGWTAKRIRNHLGSQRNETIIRNRNAAQIASLTSELNGTAETKSSCQWRAMEVVKVVDESKDARSYYLADPYGLPLPDFYPGQYLMIRPALAGTYQTTRCYSLSVAPNPKFWRITVKRQNAESLPRVDRKTGALSHWLHDHIRDGDCLLVGGPGGQFFLEPANSSPLVLLAAGVGITPMASMLQFSLLNSAHRPVNLYYQVKDLDHWPLGREVHACCNPTNSAHVRIVTYATRDNSETFPCGISEWMPGEFRSGRIDIPSIVAEVNAVDAHYFMCGPDPWMESMRTQLSEAGIPNEQIHWESFGGSTRLLQASDETPVGHEVRFDRSDTVAAWENPEVSLWELAQSNDVMIPSGCLSGACGSCRVKILKGTVAYDRKVGASLAPDECLACVARPTSDLIIDC